MKINADGIDLIKRWEGVKLEAYLCPAKVWTIGYGHTRTAKQGMKITQTEAERLLRSDLQKFEQAVKNVVKVDLTDNQFAALVSWTYNIGESAMKSSTLIKKLNSGDYDSVPSELMRWNKVNSKPVPGLTNRRAAEGGLWSKGSFVTSRDIEPQEPQKPEAQKQASKYGGVAAVAATAATAAPVIGLPWPIVIFLVAAVFAIIAFIIFRKKG